MNRVELTAYLESLEVNVSNIKFILLLRSRLMEESVPIDYSTLIAGVVRFDMSNIPEDDDTISEIATATASYCAKVYAKLKASNLHGTPLFPAFSDLFNPFFIKVDR